MKKKETAVIVEEPEVEKHLTEVLGNVDEAVPDKAVPQKAFDKMQKAAFDMGSWKPKTDLGKKVKSGEIKDLSEILDKGQRIMEAEIVDALLPNYEVDLLLIGQSKGKFGGGKRGVFKQTQKKTNEGNKPHFSTLIVIGNRNGYVGIGHGSSKETVPAREKAMREARLNMIKIRRGSGSWDSDSNAPTSIPFTVSGRCSGVTLTLMPAPKGTGLCVEGQCAKILALAGIKDVRSRTSRRTTKLNLLKACFDALVQLTKIKVTDDERSRLGIVEGPIGRDKEVIPTVEELTGASSTSSQE